MKFLNNKVLLIAWIIIFLILSVFLFWVLFVSAMDFAYQRPTISQEAQSVLNRAESLWLEAKQFGLDKGQQQQWQEWQNNQDESQDKNITNIPTSPAPSDDLHDVYNYDGINCDSTDKIKVDCDFIRNVTNKLPIFASSDSKYCITISYDKGFYSKDNKYTGLNKDLCISPDTSRDGVPGVCDEKEIYCIKDGFVEKHADTKTIVLMVSLILSLIVLIALLTRLFFASTIGGRIILLILIFVLFAIYYLLFAKAKI